MTLLDFFHYGYRFLMNRGRSKVFSPFRFAWRKIANAVLPVWFCIVKGRGKCRARNVDLSSGDVVISLTSFPARIKNVWLTIESLLRQTHLPDAIIIWLSKEQFPTLECVPKKLLDMQHRGVKIFLVDGDLRSHKKYFYTFSKYSDCNIILVDDDIFYPSDMVENLLSASAKNPDRVICRYAKKITWINYGSVLGPYIHWPLVIGTGEPGRNVFFGSGGGTLFPAGTVHPNVTNLDFLKICPQADDVWLNAMARLVSNEIISIWDTTLLPVENKRSETLSASNVFEGKNDEQIQAVRDYCSSNFGADPFEQDKIITSR